MSTPPTRRLSAAAVGLALLASGCGVGAEVLRPGTAAEVGGTTITVGELDDNAGLLCDTIEDLVEAGNAQATSGSAIRRDALQSMLLREVGGQLAEEYGVGTGESYATALESISGQLEEFGVPDGDREQVAMQLTAGQYYSDILVAIGQERLGLSPSEDADGESLQEGLRVSVQWQDENGIAVNPRYGTIRLDDTEGVVTGRADTSVAVSELAVRAAESGGAVGDLPASQRCG